MTGLAAFLVREGLITADEMAAVMAARARPDESLVAALRRAGAIAGDRLAAAVARYFKLPLADDGASWVASPAATEHYSVPFLREQYVFPLSISETEIVLAIEDPSNEAALQAARLAAGRNIRPVVANGEHIERAIEKLSVARRDTESKAEVVSPELASGESIEHLRDLALDTPVIRILNELIEAAVYARATDIHIEPFDNKLIVRTRIDGMLRDMPSPPARLSRAIVSRIKILSGLNIAEQRIPQDGRARLRIGGRQLDLRVATVPTIHGEAVAIRILENARRTLDLKTLGFRPEAQSILAGQLTSPHGMIIVTGPTGSGKTTTLATLLSGLNQSHRKILTIEDPIEYELERINQTQVKPAIGLTFASALRSFLRHDPDVIMVGEMRDQENASIGVHAALTGHLVLTTLHTNTAAGAITRLLDMGVDGFLLASCLRCVIGQRLVRLLCQTCRRPYRGPVPDAQINRSLIRLAGEPTPQIWKAAGCPRCSNTGYSDRCVISEIMVIDGDTRRLIAPGHTANEIEDVAVGKGMVTMREDGLSKCLEGLTSIEEIQRVVSDA